MPITVLKVSESRNDMVTGDRDLCDPETLCFQTTMLNHELPNLSLCGLYCFDQTKNKITKKMYILFLYKWSLIFTYRLSIDQTENGVISKADIWAIK